MRATHSPTGIQARAGERRSLDQNKQRALARLRLQVALDHRTARPGALDQPIEFTPSECWSRRVENQRIRVGARHDDLAPLLAEVLDLLDWVDLDLPRAARLLEVTTAQLVRFLRVEPAALALVNRRRKERGMPVYRP